MKKILTVSLLMCSSACLANNWGWGLYLEQGYIDEDTAYEQGIGDELQGGGVSASWETGIADNQFIQLQAGVGVVSASDEDEFKVNTIDRLDNARRRSSSVSGSSFFLEGGYENQFESGFGIFFNVGHAIYDLDRSISNCPDCPEEDIDLDGSSYFHIGGSYAVSDSSRIRLGYQNYYSGDMINNVRIQWVFP